MQSSPVILALDTAHAHCQVGVITAQGTFFGASHPLARGHAEVLIDQVNQVLEQAGLSLQNVERIVTTVGPGSFTGLRVGIAAARGFGFALKVPVIGISSLEALALNIHSHSRRKLVVIDARREEFFMQIFKDNNQPETKPTLLSPDQVASIVAPDMVMVGSGSRALGRRSDLAEIIEESREKLAANSEIVDIEALARYASVLDPALYPPEPVYVRSPDAKPQTKGRVLRA